MIITTLEKTKDLKDILFMKPHRDTTTRLANITRSYGQRILIASLLLWHAVSTLDCAEQQLSAAGEAVYNQVCTTIGIRPDKYTLMPYNYKKLEKVPLVQVSNLSWAQYNTLPRQAARAGKTILRATITGAVTVPLCLGICGIGAGVITDSWVIGVPSAIIGCLSGIYPGMLLGALYGSWKAIFHKEFTVCSTGYPDTWQAHRATHIFLYSKSLNDQLARLGSAAAYKQQQ